MATLNTGAAKTPPSPASQGFSKRISDEALLVHIKAIHGEVKQEYGWSKMWKELVAIPLIVTDDSGIVTGRSGDRDRRNETVRHSALWIVGNLVFGLGFVFLSNGFQGASAPPLGY